MSRSSPSQLSARFGEKLCSNPTHIHPAHSQDTARPERKPPPPAAASRLSLPKPINPARLPNPTHGSAPEPGTPPHHPPPAAAQTRPPAQSAPRTPSHSPFHRPASPPPGSRQGRGGPPRPLTHHGTDGGDFGDCH